jgi:hypothetical protein
MERMRHAVAEAAVAIDDVEGFWTQGKDLSEARVYALNEAIRDGKAKVVQESDRRWLITLGRGHTYLVEPMLRCSVCHQTLWASEAVLPHPVHTICYHAPAWD